MCNRIQEGFEGTGVVLGKDKERGKRWDGPWSLFHLWTCHAPLPAGPCNPCHWGLMLPTWSLTVRHWRESFPSALGPIQGLCLLWELLRGEKVLRIHPFPRERRETLVRCNKYGSEEERKWPEYPFLYSWEAVALEFDLMPATHLPLTFPLMVHSLWGHQLRVFHLTGPSSVLLCRTSQTQNYHSQTPVDLNFSRSSLVGKGCNYYFILSAFHHELRIILVVPFPS